MKISHFSPFFVMILEYQKNIWKVQQIERRPHAPHKGMVWSKWLTPLIPILDARWSACYLAPQRLFCRGASSTYPISIETNWFQSQRECFVWTHKFCYIVRYQTTISLVFQTHILGTIAPPLSRSIKKKNMKYKTHRYVHKIWLYNFNSVKNDFSTLNYILLTSLMFFF
jgi:hypothetical protein